MTTRRIVALFGAFLTAFAVVMGRLFLLARNQDFADTAQAQTVTTLPLDYSRGDLYDCKGRNLTAYGVEYYALSIPGESSYAQLFDHVPYAQQSLLYSRRNSHEPFLVQVDQDLSSLGIYTYAVPSRYFPVAVAPHLVGYVNGEGEGVSGLELAFEEVLGSQRTLESVQCVTTAQGDLVGGSEPQLITQQGQSTGVMLTLDETIQRACEGVAQKNMTQGCVLVLEVDSARVRASVSLPEFDPRAVEKSIEAQDTSLLNRVLCQYNVGSVFKPVLAAAALEKTWDWYTYDCEGSVDLNGHVYRCALSRAHGQMNLTSALEKSCNCFFIELGLNLGGEAVSQAAEDFGFGDAVYLAGGLQSAAGNLPRAQRLQDLGQAGRRQLRPGRIAGHAGAGGGRFQRHRRKRRLAHPQLSGGGDRRGQRRNGPVSLRAREPAGDVRGECRPPAGNAGQRGGAGPGQRRPAAPWQCGGQNGHRPDRHLQRGGGRADELLVRRFLARGGPPVHHRGHAGRHPRACRELRGDIRSGLRGALLAGPGRLHRAQNR